MRSRSVPDALLVGNNLAVLVAAAELGAAGRDVVLVTDGRPPGGHFRGLRVDDTDFDVGMVLLESGGAGPEEAPDLATYRPGVRYDWTRFADRVDRWLRAQVPVVRTPTPEVLVERRRWPDHLVADRLEVFAAGGLTPPVPMSRDDPRHAAGKRSSPAYDTLTYGEAAALNHGEDVHRRLVEPFLSKLVGPVGDGLLARYHRAAWLPLFWPETVADACAGRPPGLPEHPFWTTASGFVGELVRVLEQRLSELPGVLVTRAAVQSLSLARGGWEVRTEDGGRWAAARPVLGVGVERLQALLDLPAGDRPPGASVAAVLCLVRGAAIGAPVGCLSVLDPEFTTYRITDQDAQAGRDPAWHRVVLEAGPAAVERHRAGEDVTAELVSELSRLLQVDGDPGTEVRVLRTVTAPGAVTVPTAAAVAADEAAHGALSAACSPAMLTGALLGLGVTSMNDQVVQGLAVAQQLG
jgi:predicted NAD/FAD-dependent oxidoreductase